MDQWLDSLSEDWVSQPRSPHSSSPLAHHVLEDSSCQKSDRSQSRIPRYKPRAASGLSASYGEEVGRASVRRRSGFDDLALKEKSASNLNASKRILPDERQNSQTFKSATTRLPARQASMDSVPSQFHDTVQHKSSPVKSRDVEDTPEWKRRILKENAGKGDLFSPMELESVFRPPTVKPSMQGYKGKRKCLPSTDFQCSPPERSRGPEQAATHGSLRTCGTSALSDDLLETLDSFLAVQDKKAMNYNMTPTKSSHLDNRNKPLAARSHSPSLPPLKTDQVHSPAIGLNTTHSPDQIAHNSSEDKTRDENISPVYVSRQDTGDGRVEFAAIDISIRRLREEMEKLRLQQRNLSSSRSSDHRVDFAENIPGAKATLRDMDEVTSLSLPDDLSMGTEAFAANGGFVSTHRGGYSNDGSFERRPFSPSLLPDLDGPSLKIPSSSLKELAKSSDMNGDFAQTKSKTPSSQPQTPRHEGDPSSNEPPKSSGSPLKLFDKYDTFTNERLARRMSKFEETMNHGLTEDAELRSGDRISTPPPGPKMLRTRNQPRHSGAAANIRRISCFDDGELDDHQFSASELKGSMLAEQMSLESCVSLEVERSYSCDPSRSQARTSRNGRRDRLGHRSWSLQRERRGARNGTERTTKDLYGTDIVVEKAMGKRLPHSAVNGTAAKRRRSLCSTVEPEREQQFAAQGEVLASSLLGRKRKDARYDGGQQAADPSTLARRQILRPRGLAQASSTGLLTRSTHQTHANGQSEKETQGFKGGIPLSKTASPAVDPPTQIVAGALATVALNKVQDVTTGCRKASVTTSDFFNEAQQIMQLIRAKGRPKSSHATTEAASDDDVPVLAEDSMLDDFTKDEFERPPSREHDKLSSLRAPAQKDARAVSHLRKYKDDEDLGLALRSSSGIIQATHEDAELGTDALQRSIGSGSPGGMESDPPNVRIRESIHPHEGEEQSSQTFSNAPAVDEKQQNSRGFQTSSGQSSSKSNPTISSHSSTNRMVIAPETVAHLLSDQMAGMVFDRQRQLWVKRKSSQVGCMDNTENTLREGTEDDLFGDIPDLSVNEMEELRLVKDAVSSVKSQASAKDKVFVRDQAPFATSRDEVTRSSPKPADAFRPRTAEGKAIDVGDDSSAPSKYSHFASSGPIPGTRATSWGDDALPLKADRMPEVAQVEHRDQQQDVEHEISILDGRSSPVSTRRKSRNARVVTVTFSSPLSDEREIFNQFEDKYRSEDEGSEVQPSGSASTRTQRRLFPHIRSSFGKAGKRSFSRRQSFGNHSYTARPMSPLDEIDEGSLVHCPAADRQMSMEVAIKTPLPLSRSLMVAPTTEQRSNADYNLSPLPEFTVHQIDRPVDQDLGLLASKHQDKLSLAAQDLLRQLTDLSPYEPYWDDIRTIDLYDRVLKTLHPLDEFCGYVEELDASQNQISELNGIPKSVRSLNIRGNCLSDLAAWHAVYNLQYLDVSENQLTSLRGFHSLIHLRALKADQNNIENLDGIEGLDGLTSLSVSSNRLRAVDFEHFNLRRLNRLDLSHNELADVFNLHRLTALESCNLSHNDLSALDFAISVPMLKLESLNVSNNRLSFLDLAECPNLQTLKLDKNSISSIESLNSLKHLETVSWREQTVIPAYGSSEIQYQHCHEVRTLYLSGNPLSTFAPSSPFLNLQHLELASTGLQSLSPDFGPRCPNLRILNLNFNAIRDLRPLLGIVKLQRLHAAGNRISRLRRTVAVLERLGRELGEVDFRNNPLTVGYYTPQRPGQEKSVVTLRRRKQGARSEDGGDDDDGGGEAQAARAYLLPGCDAGRDEVARERLDEDTKVRRKVYEILIGNACRKVRWLDGVEVGGGGLGRRDGMWERLVELGVLRVGGGRVEGRETEGM